VHLDVLPRTELSLRVLQALATGGRWRAADIAAAVGSTTHYVARLAAPLTQAGWLRSTPGPTGGHELVADLGTISVLELIEAVEGPTDSGRCALVDRPCPSPEPCALHDAWIPAREALIARLASTPLSALERSPEVST
jgi:Rrf2 family protein